MKLIFCIACLALGEQVVFSQEFQGFRSGNFTGVNAVFFNPASIAGSRYRFDINLVSFGSSVGNSQASFNLNSIFQSGSQNNLQDKFLGKQAGLSNGLLNLDIHGPSFMFNAGKTITIAITSRARAVGNMTNIDGKLIQTVSDSLSRSQLPYVISSSSNMKINMNAWSEYGVSFSKVASDKNGNFFKAGITLKYLAGIADGYVNIDHLNSTINYDNLRNDAYVTNTTGHIEAGFGGANISNLQVSDFTKKNGSGFGADLGIIYEYRPRTQAYRADSTGSGGENNGYPFRIGISVLDMGKIKYDRDAQRSGAYDINITGSNRLYSGEISNVRIGHFNSFFKSRPQLFTPTSSNNASNFKASLPTTMHLDVDYHLHRGFYLNLAGQFPLSSNDQYSYNSMYFTSVTLTPRYEGKAVGFYLPLNSNTLWA